MRSLPLDMASVSICTTYAGSPRARSSKEAPENLFDVNWANHAGVGSLAKWQGRLMRSFFLRPRFIVHHIRIRVIPFSSMVRGALLLLVDALIATLTGILFEKWKRIEKK